MPVARALAKRLRLDLAAHQGQRLATGLITLDDVLQRAHVQAPPRARSADAACRAPPARQPSRCAARAAPWRSSMSLSRAIRSPLSTVCDDADIHAWAPRGDYMLRLMRALIAAWRVEPALNAWYDAADNSRILFGHIDLAIAVDTPGGLIVPVLRNIEQQIARRAARGASRRKRPPRTSAAPRPEDLRDFTLMLSNFGTLAGRYGMPHGGAAGGGDPRRRQGAARDAVAVGGTVVAHRRMPLSLSFDHRCITGGEACRFLAALSSADLEKPE